MEFKEEPKGTIKVTIDKQNFPLYIKEIDKEDTFFTINKSFNTPLYSYIDIDITLEKSRENDTDTEENDVDEVEFTEENNTRDVEVVESGSVTLTIRDINNANLIYDEQTVNFYNGVIQTQMTNSLSLGDYILEINYFGNKYYNPASLIVHFSIEKREIKCILDNEYIDGYPESNISFGATFKDVLTDIPISNCTINYIFDDTTYITQTDKDGYVVFNVTVPEVNPYRCFKKHEEDTIDTNTQLINEDESYYIDADGNLQLRDNVDSEVNGIESTFINDDTTTEDIETTVDIVEDELNDEDEEEILETSSMDDMTYIMTILIDDNVYYSSDETFAYIHSKSVNTEVNFIANTNNDGQIHIEGDVVSKDDYGATNITYGKVIPSISNIITTETYEVNEFGHFTFDIDIPSPIMSQKEPTVFSTYDVQIPTSTKLISNTDEIIHRSWAQKNYVDFVAQVKVGSSPVYWSMVTFFIFKGDKEIYRYITELNSDGEAFFNFNVSTLGTFKVKAVYHGMFGYLSSSSQTMTYTVKEE